MSTKPCPQCGSAVPEKARFCGQCGRTFALDSAAQPAARPIPTTVDEATADPPPAAPRPHVGMPTMIGHMPAAPAASAIPAATPPPPAAASSAALGKTMLLGGASSHELLPKADLPASSQRLPAAPPAVPPPFGSHTTAPMQSAPIAVAHGAPAQPFAGTVLANAPGSDKQTMVGLPASNLPAPAAAGAAQPQNLPPAMKTMLGVAIPGIAPTRDAAPAASPAPPPSSRPAGTLLGVAVPGIAPVHAGRPAPNPALAQTALVQAAPPPPIVPAPAPLVDEPLPEAPEQPVKRGVPAIAVVGIVFVLVAIIGTVAALLVLRSGPALSAQPQLDETGKESLKIRCASCPDGTTIALGASSAKVEKGDALLALPAPLAIGDNDLEMKIDRPGAGRDETVRVHVPVAYRVKADLTTLTASPPTVTVRVEATPGTEVTVDGKPVALDGSGKAAPAFDVSAEVEGPSDEPKAIDKKIPFTIKPKGGAPETGQLVVHSGVVPLHMDAPGLRLYTEQPTVAISGQTKPGGTLTVDGQAVTLDPQGRFGVRVELPGQGDKVLTIVAQAPPLALRTVKAKVTRVASLEAQAKALEAAAPLTFDAFTSEPASEAGKPVYVEGEVLESRATQGFTVLLVEEKKACSGAAGACVVRIVHGEELRAARGDTVRVHGRLEGTVSSGGKTIPDVTSSLVLVRPGKPGAKR